MNKIYLVSTPIGNLEDISIRAIKVLKSVFCIFAEDTREFKKLSAMYEIETQVLSYHDFSSPLEKKRIFQMLEKGSIAIVSDRGTPIFNDPGFDIIKDWANVTVIPGASAILPSVMLGRMGHQFSFFGFIKNSELIQLKYHKLPMVFFVSPHNINSFLDDAFIHLGSRKVVICRELTKIHEEVLSFSLKEEKHCLNLLGEMTVVIEPYNENVMDENLIKKIKTHTQISTKDLTFILKEIFHYSTNQIYNYLKSL